MNPRNTHPIECFLYTSMTCDNRSP